MMGDDFSRMIKENGEEEKNIDSHVVLAHVHC